MGLQAIKNALPVQPLDQKDVIVLRSSHTGELYTPPSIILSSIPPPPFLPLREEIL